MLDVLFVRSFHLGIAGAAWATVISQCASAILVMVVLSRAREAYRVDCFHLRIQGSILSKICGIGVPSALQMGITSFSNVFVQSYINRFASSCMAGWTAYNKIDAIAMLPMLSLSMSITTFVGQNLGAGDHERARSAPKVGMLMGLVIMTVILTPLMIFAPHLVRLFNGDAEVIRYGTWFIRVISPFYLTFAVNQVYMGALRGAGNIRITMIIALGSFVAFRQLYLFVSYHLGGGLTAVTLGYPAGWLLCAVLMQIYYHSKRNTVLFPEKAKSA